MFCDRMYVKKFQRIHPSSFSAMWDFFRKAFFSAKGFPVNFVDVSGQKFWKILKSRPFLAPIVANSVQLLRFSGTVKVNTWHF